MARDITSSLTSRKSEPFGTYWGSGVEPHLNNTGRSNPSYVKQLILETRDTVFTMPPELPNEEGSRLSVTLNASCRNLISGRATLSGIGPLQVVKAIIYKEDQKRGLV
jgi:hypothetical protein